MIRPTEINNPPPAYHDAKKVAANQEAWRQKNKLEQEVLKAEAEARAKAIKITICFIICVLVCVPVLLML